MKQTSNYSLKKPEATDVVNIDDLNTNFDTLDVELKKVSDKANYIQTAGGTGTAITLNNITLANGFTITFIVAANNNGSATTINGKALYKAGGTSSPNLLTGKAVTVWYNGTNFFIKASATGTAVAETVLAGKTFSNDSDTDIVGTMINRSGTANAVTWSNTDGNVGVDIMVPNGYYDGNTNIVAGDEELISGNIKAGVHIFGVNGSPTVVNTADSNATSSQVLSGASAYVNGEKIEGLIPVVNGDAFNHILAGDYCMSTALDGSLNAFMRLPEGKYLNTNAQWIRVPQPNLISQNIKSGKTIFGVTGSAIVVEACSQISGLSLIVPASGSSLIASWTNPTDTKLKGVRIVAKEGSYPTSPTDGIVGYDSNDGGIATSCTITGLSNGTVYYVRGFTYTYQNATRLYQTATSGAQAYATPLNTKGSQTFTSSGTFTVPVGVYSIQVFAVGGGGGGGKGYSGLYLSSNGGGGGGGYTKTAILSVSPNQQYAVVVGAGGGGATALSTDGNGGGQSTFGDSLVVAYGGNGGHCNSNGGAGGSGGGGGYYYEHLTREELPGNGGADGGNGGGTVGGTGQGSTTRAFGEGTNTLYSGGGGGASGNDTAYIGGSGGGGNGYVNSGGGISPTSGQANTGGGGGGDSYHLSNAGDGGSGIVIVRWGY